MPFVKLFSADKTAKLEDLVNDWIEENSQVVIDKIEISQTQEIYSTGMSVSHTHSTTKYLAKIEYIGKRVK
jgi:hypothetical protein